MANIMQVRWRVGTKLGRTLYAQTGVESDHDTLLGMMDTKELAARVVRDHNTMLKAFDE